MLLVASALFLGFLHGLGADHLMAIAALSAGTAGETLAIQRTRALGVAVRFAAGHAMLLAGGAAILLAVGWSLPLVFERAGEILGGGLLIALGGIGLWGLRAGRIYGHAHRHASGPAAPWHLHMGRRERHPGASAHSHVPTMVGAAFALSSLRALTMVAPVGGSVESTPVWLLIVLIMVFAVGILLSMSLFGVALARVMSAAVAARLGGTAACVMALTSIALGVFWILSA